VNGVRSAIADATCGSTAGAGGFACSGRLPTLPPGTHTLELAAFSDTDGIIESAKSPPLRVTVAAVTSPDVVTPLETGEILTSVDGVRLTTQHLADALDDITDFAILPDGRVAVAERAGRVRIVANGPVSGAPNPAAVTAAADGAILALAVGADFGRTGQVFVMHAPPGAFRLVRYRLAGGALVDRMPLIRDIPAAAEPSAALRVGPDAKLYAAFDDGENPDAAARLSEWSGKILRLNADGSTPDDQPAASPVFWSGLRSPRGLDWTLDGAALWIAQRGVDGLDRMAALVTGPERPRRASQRVAYTLPQPLGARSLALHRGQDIPQFRGDMFVAASEAGYLLRVRFSPSEPLRAVSSERLLEGRIGLVRGVAVSSDGALYVASDSALWRLARIR
jgi:glucose/arabinose dehydrogenase